ncbi:MAG: LamG-like jellyroll fold domain-containing protein [Actinomycetes bacterium]
MADASRKWARVLSPAVIAVAIAIPAGQAHAATAPKLTTAPVLSGQPTVGQAMATTAGTWSGSPAPTFTYLWQRCVVGGSCSNISGSAATTYVVVAADKGKQLRSRVIATNSAGSKTAFSARSTAVTAGAAPANTAAPTVSGTPTDGALLSSTNGTWTGQTPITFTYVWQRCLNGTCSSISGAKASTYQLAHADVGKTVQLRVTGTNTAGSSNATSASTALIAAAPPTNNSLPTTVGTPTSGQSLSSTPGSWNGTPPFTYAYQWNGCDSVGANCQPISGATKASYTPAAADIGDTLVLSVTASNGTNPAGAANSALSAVVVTGPNPPVNNAPPTIDKPSPFDGTVLHVTVGTWTNQGPLLHNWQQCDSTGAACTSIAGATGSSYTLVSGDVGHTIRVLETSTNADGSASTPSASTNVARAAAPVNTAVPSMSGALVDGATLTSTPGTWSGTPTVTFTYQWQTSPDNAAWTDLTGATLDTYTLGPGDVGDYVRVVVTGHNDASSTGSAPAPSQGPVAPAPVAVVVNPSVSGATAVQSTLTVSPGTWSGTNVSDPAYTWLRCPQGVVPPDVSTCTGVFANSGTPAQYTLVDADRDSVVVVAVTRSNTVNTVTAYTAPSGVVVGTGPVNTALPAIQGTAEVGDTLSATPGGWAPSDNGYTYQPGDLTFQYLWQQCTDANTCAPEESGSTAPSYLVRTYDDATTISVSVTVTDKYGQSSTSAMSQPTGTVVGSPGAVTVANWSMADGADGTMHDSSGYGNDGTLRNVAIGQADHSAAIAYGFPKVDGSMSRVLVPHSSSLNPGTKKFTVSLHLRFDAWPSAAVGDFDLLRKGLGSDDQDWKIEIMEDGHARCYTNGKAGPGDLLSANSLSKGSWHTIVCTFSTSSVSVQVDGGSVKAKNTSIGAIANKSPMSISAKFDPSGADDGGDQYTGKMDQVVVTSG